MHVFCLYSSSSTWESGVDESVFICCEGATRSDLSTVLYMAGFALTESKRKPVIDVDAL